MVTIQNNIDNTIGASNSGAANVLTIQNPSNTAASQAYELLTVGGTSAGDTWTQYSAGTSQSYAVGISNANSQDFYISSSQSGSITPSTGTPLQRFTSVSTAPSVQFPIVSGFLGTTAIGASVNWHIENMDNTSSSSHASILLQVGGTSGGNPYIGYDGPAHGFSEGIVNSSSLFEIQNNATFGSGTALITFNNSGAVSIPAGVLTVANGITFDGSNVLDNYVSESTWTPTIFGSSTAGTTTYGVQTGYYTRIGSLVFLQVVVSWTAMTGTGNLTMGGLPFTVKNVNSLAPTFPVRADGIALPASTVNLVGQGEVNTTNCNFVGSTVNGVPSAVSVSNTTSSIVASFFYFI